MCVSFPLAHSLSDRPVLDMEQGIQQPFLALWSSQPRVGSIDAAPAVEWAMWVMRKPQPDLMGQGQLHEKGNIS